MAYYDRHYYGEQTQRASRWPKLGLVSKIVLGVIVAAYLAVLLTSNGAEPSLAAVSDHWLSAFVLTPEALLFPDESFPKLWQLLTSVLFGQSVIDVALTCIVVVWLVGASIERVLGSKHYAILIATSALAGNIVAACIDPVLRPDGIVSLGFVPVEAALFLTMARIAPAQRGLFGLTVRTWVYIILGLILLMAINSYLNPATPAVVRSIPAMIGGGAWALLYDKRFAQHRAGNVQTDRQQGEDDFVAYANKFKVEGEAGAAPEKTEKRSITRQRKRAETRKNEEEAQLNKLLDRIAKDGVSSLSRTEKAFLERVSREKREGVQ